jgi:transposase
MAEVIDPDNLKKRYCLCRNPESAKRENQTRENLLALTVGELEKIAAGRKKKKEEEAPAHPAKKTRPGKKGKVPAAEKIGARVGRVLQRYKMGKFIQWSVVEGRLEWQLEEEKIEAERRFDGCYVIVADVPPEKMAKAEVVASYKKLSFVEQAFRNLKTVQLEVRPVYHKKDERIRAHVFICLLAYYVQWHALKRLRPLFEQDGEGKEKQWTFAGVIERLAAIRSNRVKSSGVEFELQTQAGTDQQKILDLLAKKEPVAMNVN